MDYNLTNLEGDFSLFYGSFLQGVSSRQLRWRSSAGVAEVWGSFTAGRPNGSM